MELQTPLSLSPFFTFFLFLLLFLLFKMVKRSSESSKIPTNTMNLPPGPWKLPVIGNMHQLIGSMPHHSFTTLAAKYGPLMHLQLGEVSTLVVSSSEMAKEIMKTHDLIFSNRPLVLAVDIIFYNATDIVFSPYGGYWRQLRKICTIELFTTHRVQSFRSVREEAVSELIKAISSSEGSIINLSEMLFSLTSRVTTHAAFGRKFICPKEFKDMVNELSDLAGGFHVADLYPSIKVLRVISGMKAKLEMLRRKFDRVLTIILDDHTSRRSSTNIIGEEEEDIVDILLKFQRQNDSEFPLTDDNIKAVILDIFSGGSDTTAVAMVWAMSEMMRNPDVMEAAQAEVRRVFNSKGYLDETDLHQLKYLKCVIKETLRLHPPFPFLIPRESRERCEINGHEIPAKSKIIINAWAIGRDPRHWNEAERFKPERFLDNPNLDFRGTDFEFIPFGGGRRVCPGIIFAMASIEHTLAHLLYHFDWRLPRGMKRENLDMSETFGVSLDRKNPLCLIPVKRYP